MKFLISTDIPAFRAVANDSVYVQFCEPGPKLLTSLIDSETVNVWICNGREVSSELLDLWLGQAYNVPKIILVKDPATLPRLQEYSKGRASKIASLPPHLHPNLPWAESVLRTTELLYARTRAHKDVQWEPVVKSHDGQSTVLLVGAGIMNLVTAELLLTQGFQVRIVDSSPDPRTCKDWTRQGVTNGGGNARMFTHTEADNYNEKGSEIYQNMRTIFRKTARNGGWSVKSPKDFNAAESAWVDAFEQIPAWLARGFREDIYSVNRDGGKLWQKLMESAPQLFEDVGFREGILRMYVEPVALDAAFELNRQLGTIVNGTSPEEFLEAHPWFIPAAKSDHLAGGFTAEGFTVNIHPFVRKLMDRINSLGGQFTWDCQVNRMHRNLSGEVTTLESQHGRLEADHFVVSPGVGGNTLLRGTASENLIQGVLGVWLQIPNLHPQLQNSIKIHRRGHLVEDINITVAKDTETGEDILMLGGGYGFAGQDRPSADNPELMALFQELREVARIYFPRGHAMATERGTMWPGQNYKFCVRPFTSTGLGMFEKIPTASGGQLIINGGNNTGGFTQAPAIARAVLHALIGKSDPIHVLFHPDRGRLPVSVTDQKLQLHQPSVPRSIEARSPPPRKVLQSYSEAPQHSYLGYRFFQAFPGYRSIVETGKVAKGMWLWWNKAVNGLLSGLSTEHRV